ncbi:MAG: hypothetical protein H6536_00840 [Bacteroidales bacterium]|nr:hypothetical protein [Bacteroidales bacterium]
MKRLNTITSYTMAISAGIAILCTLFAAFNIELSSKSEFILTAVEYSPFVLVILFFIALLVKSIIAQKTGWTRWTCVAIGAIWLISLNLAIFSSNAHNETPSKWLIVLMELFFLPFFILPLVIKNSYWTKWLLAAYSFFATITAGIALIAFSAHFKGVEIETNRLYLNSDNSNIYVANFKRVGPSASERQYQVHKYAFLMKKTPFDYWTLTGKWKGYDDDGIIISECVYNNGTVEECTPIIPEGSILIETPEALNALSNATENSRYVINGDIKATNSIEIGNKNGITLLGVTMNSNPKIYSSSQTPTTITFRNCNNIKIQNIQFDLQTGTNPAILSFHGCKNVDISKCRFNGKSAYSLTFDNNCDSITLTNNSMEGFAEYGVRVHSSYNTSIEENKFIQHNEITNSNMVWIADCPRQDVAPISFTDICPYIQDHFFDNDNSETVTINEDTQIGAYYWSALELPYALGIYTAISQKLCPNVRGSHTDAINTLAFVSGINPIAPQNGQYPNLSFNRINPKFVEWGATLINKDIIPLNFYNIVLKRFARMMCESYLYLNKNEDLENLQYEYAKAANRDMASGFIKYRFQHALPHYNINSNNEEYNKGYDEEADYATPENGEEQTDETNYSNYYTQTEEVPCMMGFWIRRVIDGSAKSIWKATLKFMQTFDPEWLKETMYTYEMALPEEQEANPNDELSIVEIQEQEM